MTTPLAEPFKVNGRYEIGEKPLTPGAVYQAYDSVSKRSVLLKISLDGNDRDSSTLEETALRRLTHPNIVEVLDEGAWSSNGQQWCYVVTPSLPGQTLAEFLQTTRELPPIERAIEIAVQACAGLQAAHEAGLLHRNISPSRIFLLASGAVQLLDFGLAAEGPLAAESVRYAAPEQLDRQAASALSDVFSLGVVCYELLGGRQPFEREDEAETAQAVRAYLPPPLRELNGNVNRAISQAVEKAMAKQPYQRFSSAREFSETLQRALRKEPNERVESSKIQPRIERVKKAYAEGDFQFAVEILRELEAEGHLDPAMPALRTQIEQATRQKNIRQLLASARVRMQEEEYPLALQKVADVLRLDPANADAQTLQGQIERLRTESQLESWFRLVREQRDNNLFSQARQGLQEILRLDAGNAQAQKMLTEIEETEQEIIKARQQKQRLYESAVASYRGGEVNAALTRLERVLALSRQGGPSISPDLDAQCRNLYDQVREQRDAARSAYAEGRRQIAARNVPRALEICNEYLEKHPDDPMFQALKIEAEELQRQQLAAAVAEVNRQVDAEADLEKKIGLLKEGIEKYPDEPHFRSAMKLIRDRRDLVNTIVARARNYEDRGEFEDASGQWDILRNIYPLFPGLDSESERLTQRQQEHLHFESQARRVEEIDEHLKVGDYAAALATIEESLKEFPANQDLRHLQSIAELGAKRGAKAAELLKQGHELCAAQKYEEGLAALRKAERLDPRNSLARAALLSGLMAQARELVAKDWRAAEPLVKEALELEPSDPVARSLLSILEDHRRQDAVAALLSSARAYQADGRIADARQAVARGVAHYPHDPRLTQLLKSLEAEEQEAPQPRSKVLPRPTSAPPLPLAVEAPLKALAPPDTGLAKSAPAALSRPLANPVLSLAVQQPRTLERRAPAPPPPVFRPPLMLAEPRFKGGFWGVMAAALALIIAALIYSLTHKAMQATPEKPRVILADARVIAAPLSAHTRPVLFEANISDTRFSENGVTLPAAADLMPGNHAVEASHDGYFPNLMAFAVDPNANTPTSVKFDLRPIPTQLRLTSSIATGKVVLDDATTLDLQSGAVSKEDVAPGPHTIKVFDQQKQVFALGFEARLNEMPVLLAPLGSQPLQGTVIASLGADSKAYSTSETRATQPAIRSVYPTLTIQLSGAGP